MGQPYVGEIRMVGFNFEPVDWMFCNGQLLQISEYETLFNLIGTTYGGDGQTTFALPNLQGRIPFHQGSAPGGVFIVGESAGTEEVTLELSQIPAHSHTLMAQGTTGHRPSPSGSVWAMSSLEQFSNQTPSAAMAANLDSTGRNDPHNNMPPYLAINFIISLYGVFPAQG